MIVRNNESFKTISLVCQVNSDPHNWRRTQDNQRPKNSPRNRCTQSRNIYFLTSETSVLKCICLRPLVVDDFPLTFTCHKSRVSRLVYFNRVNFGERWTGRLPRLSMSTFGEGTGCEKDYEECPGTVLYSLSLSTVKRTIKPGTCNKSDNFFF